MNKKIKILHIGKEGNLKLYPAPQDVADRLSILNMPANISADDYLSKASDAEIIIADAIAAVPKKMIENMPSLKMIHSEGVAYNQVDVAAAAEKSVAVCNCAGMNATAVAEQTLLLMIGMLRNVVNNDKAVRLGKQIETKENYMKSGTLKELADCKVGLLGLGNIGKSTACLLKAYGAEVFYNQRHQTPHSIEQEYNLTFLNIDDLLSTCDIVSIHIPVTESTEKMCNSDFFRKMRKGSYFVNTSRGELVDDSALVHAIENGTLAMVGLDTLNNEPVKTDNILLNQPEAISNRIIFSPHIAGITASSFKRGYKCIWDNVRRVIDGQTPVNIVNVPSK